MLHENKIWNLEKTLQAEGYSNLGILNSGDVTIPECAQFIEREHHKGVTLYICTELKLYYTQDSSD